MDEHQQNIEPSLPTTPKPVQNDGLVSISEHHLFSAPLPPPSVLAEYESVMPGLAERIVRLTEEEQKERFALERKELEIAQENLSLLKRAQWLGFSFGTATLGASLYLITHGEPAGSVAMLLSGLATLVGAFFYGNKK